MQKCTRTNDLENWLTQECNFIEVGNKLWRNDEYEKYKYIEGQYDIKQVKQRGVGGRTITCLFSV